MNFSEFKERVYAYLGVKSADAETDEKIRAGLERLEGAVRFSYRYKYFSAPPDFLTKEPYLTFLRGSRGVILCVTTLGGEVDRLIKYAGVTDAASAVVLDACASALLEFMADEYEKTVADDLSYRFCPGYGGSDVGDVGYIFEILKPEQTGVILTETGYMLPSKSMAGVISVGGGKKRNCGECLLKPQCGFIKEGKRCYGSEKK